MSFSSCPPELTEQFLLRLDIDSLMAMEDVSRAVREAVRDPTFMLAYWTPERREEAEEKLRDYPRSFLSTLQHYACEQPPSTSSG